MNDFFSEIFENIMSNNFNYDSFSPDSKDWLMAELWYYKYGNIGKISRKKLLDLLYFFYIHENIDSYDATHFNQIIQPICSEYKIEKANIFKMIDDFYQLIYR